MKKQLDGCRILDRNAGGVRRGILLIVSLSLMVGGLLAFVYQQVQAQSPNPTPSDNDVNRVAKQLYCPVCENIPLDVCGTQACAEWRELIRQKLDQGWTDQQIKDYFALQYGDRVLAEPPRRGLNWLVYILPPIFLLAGGVVVWRVLSSMQKKTASGSGSPVEPMAGESVSTPDQQSADDLYLARLEEELKNKD